MRRTFTELRCQHLLRRGRGRHHGATAAAAAHALHRAGGAARQEGGAAADQRDEHDAAQHAPGSQNFLVPEGEQRSDCLYETIRRVLRDRLYLTPLLQEFPGRAPAWHCNNTSNTSKSYAHRSKSIKINEHEHRHMSKSANENGNESLRSSKCSCSTSND